MLIAWPKRSVYLLVLRLSQRILWAMMLSASPITRTKLASFMLATNGKIMRARITLATGRAHSRHFAGRPPCCLRIWEQKLQVLCEDHRGYNGCLRPSQSEGPCYRLVESMTGLVQIQWTEESPCRLLSSLTVKGMTHGKAILKRKWREVGEDMMHWVRMR